MERHTKSSAELQDLAAEFVASLSPREKASVVALSGDLGAGKTTFTQGAAKAFGVEEELTSPTFVIEKIYQLNVQKFERFIHIDAYRLEDPHELEILGFKELLQDPVNLIFIEWPEKAGQLLPGDAIRIRFDIHGDERTISIDGGEESKSD